ncbi:AraC family transcriptional regulator ligand-binding domain-containing protein [Aquabacter sp. L1I39]|uniref:helix-turn-helix transcriptional regulator n=1 Tax=Aquabacter sp. L1I39 TaxID=2820278 RepID=UPI001ADAFAD2|nr:AraC family transcriptional regulator [Aquabacter sp. L1I39]QTL05025.1 AraC family transcriptional regulator ligand-binding domain-containing protein [Aquabacter sp. L1I39]
MGDRHPVSLAIVHMLPDLSAQHGFALGPALSRAGIPDVQDIHAGAVVARAQMCTLLQAAARQAGAPLFGFALAGAARPDALGLMGRALFSGRTPRESLSAHARSMPAIQSGVKLSVERVGDRAIWRHHMEDSDLGHASVLNDGVAGFMTGVFRALLGADAALEIGLPHRPQVAPHRYEDALQAPVTFSGGTLSFTFDAALLDRPSALPGPLRDLPLPPERRLDASDHVPGDERLLQCLPLIFESAALAGTLSLADAARTLGFSPRSLQRRLEALGLTFEYLVDEWRRGEAQRYLSQTGLPVASIAHALGYSHPAHFIRAFRRWERATPLAYRRNAGRACA